MEPAFQIESRDRCDPSRDQFRCGLEYPLNAFDPPEVYIGTMKPDQVSDEWSIKRVRDRLLAGMQDRARRKSVSYIKVVENLHRPRYIQCIRFQQKTLH